MPFINPLELFELAERNPDLLDKTTIRSAKRRILTELELSADQTYAYKSLKLNRSDVDTAGEELEDSAKLKSYHRLAQFTTLNDFLVNGTESDFQALSNTSLPSDAELLRFIGSPFAEKAGRLLVKAYNTNNDRLLQQIGTWQTVLPEEHSDQVFAGITSLLGNCRSRIERLANGISPKNGTVNVQQATEGFEDLRSEIRPRLINLLPDRFESSRSALAMALREFSINVFNEFDNAILASEIIEPARELHTDPATREKIAKDYETVSKIGNNRREQEKFGPKAQQYRATLEQITALVTWAESENSIADDFPVQVRNLVNVYEINALPEVFDELRDQMALSLRSLSVLIWNTHTKLPPAMAVMDVARALKVSPEVKSKLSESFEQLRDLEKEVIGNITCYYCAKNEGHKPSAIQKRIYKEVSRSYFPTRKVQFQYKDIPIARCANCAALHKEGTSYLWMSIGIGAAAGAGIGAVGSQSPAGTLGGAVCLALIGWAVGAIIKSQHIKKSGIRSESNNELRGYPVIASHLAEGWQFHQPTA
ncbi:MAG: hypothetical protein FD123_2204 [Bacteroidetes bacterium]|nr:MAG: hypothetical protein FD123_2204 [Bacteroidota bacterium]